MIAARHFRWALYFLKCAWSCARIVSLNLAIQQSLLRLDRPHVLHSEPNLLWNLISLVSQVEIFANCDKSSRHSTRVINRPTLFGGFERGWKMNLLGTLINRKSPRSEDWGLSYSTDIYKVTSRLRNGAVFYLSPSLKKPFFWIDCAKKRLRDRSREWRLFTFNLPPWPQLSYTIGWP